MTSFRGASIFPSRAAPPTTMPSRARSRAWGQRRRADCVGAGRTDDRRGCVARLRSVVVVRILRAGQDAERHRPEDERRLRRRARRSRRQREAGADRLQCRQQQPGELGHLLKAEIDKWGVVIKRAGIRFHDRTRPGRGRAPRSEPPLQGSVAAEFAVKQVVAALSQNWEDAAAACFPEFMSAHRRPTANAEEAAGCGRGRRG